MSDIVSDEERSSSSDNEQFQNISETLNKKLMDSRRNKQDAIQFQKKQHNKQFEERQNELKQQKKKNHELILENQEQKKKNHELTQEILGLKKKLQQELSKYIQVEHSKVQKSVSLADIKAILKQYIGNLEGVDRKTKAKNILQSHLNQVYERTVLQKLI